LRETLELARRCTVFLGNDTGAAHLAAAAGLATVTIFSGIHPPGTWEPWSPRSIAVRRRVPCDCCGSEECCPTGTSTCVRSIATDDVLEPLRRLLESAHPQRAKETAA
jgi:heptosyltransferase-2